MGRYVLSLLWLGCAMLALSVAIAPDRVLAQVGVITPPPVTCGPLDATNNTGLARLVGEAGSCSRGADATAGEYADPDTAASNITFQLILPSAGNGDAVKVFARDASGTALPMTTISCLAGGSGITTITNSTIGEISVPAGVGQNRCRLYVFWENGDNDLSFAGGLIRRTSTGTYYLEEEGVLAGGGVFDGIVSTTNDPATSLRMERNGVVINNGGTDDAGALTVGASVTLTYTVSNIGARTASFRAEVNDLTWRNVDPGSVALHEPDPSFLNLDNPANSLGVPETYLGAGASTQFTITFIPLDATDFFIDVFWQINDAPQTFDIVGSAPSTDDPTERTKRIISNFMGRRAGLIVSKEPDLSSRLGRPAPSQPSLKDAPPLKLGGPVSVMGHGTEHNNNLSFATSLRQVLQSRQLAKQRRVGDTSVLMARDGQKSAAEGQNASRNGSASDSNGRGDDGLAMPPGMALGTNPFAQPPSRFGLWAKGTWARVDDDTAKSDFGLLYIGADYRFHDDLVVGLIAQFDRTDEEDDVEGFAIEGKGWLVGPYVVARLRPNLIFDARAAWGRSNNEVSPYNTYTDDFEGRRWLVRSRLTGDFNFGRLHVAPHVGVVYFEEEQKAYVDSLGNTIGSQTVALGRLTFGPKFSTSFVRPDGTTIAPHIAVQGIWDFKRTDQVDIDTGLAFTGADKLRARAEAGLSIRLPQGLAITGEGFYDGIGANGYNAYGGSVKIGVPF